MYHKVDIVVPSDWWVSIEQFERQIIALKNLNRQFVYLDDYEAGLPTSSQVVVTFDDGYENNWRHAMPILKRHNVPFELFVIGDKLGKWNQFDRTEMKTRFCQLHHLKEIAANGGRVQWHSRSHRMLPKLDDAQLERELTVSGLLRNEFEPPHFNWFAYPYGEHDQRCEAQVKALFRGALSVDNGSDSDTYKLNRVTVTDQWMPENETKD